MHLKKLLIKHYKVIINDIGLVLNTFLLVIQETEVLQKIL